MFKRCPVYLTNQEAVQIKILKMYDTILMHKNLDFHAGGRSFFYCSF